MSDISGQFELKEADFKALLKKTGQEAQPLDFKKLFPDFLSGSNDRMPRLLQNIWRVPVDQYLKQNQERNKGHYYFQAKGCLLFFTFEEISKGAAQAKIDQIGTLLQNAMKKAATEGEEAVLNQAAENTRQAQQTEKKGSGDDTFKKIMDGLRENPSMEEVKLWASRALQNLHHGGAELPPEMVKLLESYKICYIPFWNGETGVLVGACCEVNPYGTPANNEGQLIRDNMAVLAATQRELERLTREGKQAVIVLPLQAKALFDPGVSEFIVAFIRKIPDTLRKCIIVEIRNPGQSQLAPAVKAHLETITPLCRALLVDTGILQQPDLSKESFKVHAYGCSFNEVRLEPQKMVTLIKKYNAAYNARKIKTYIKNLPDYQMLEMCKESGFTYITSPMLLRPRLACPTATRMSIDEIKAMGAAAAAKK